MKRSPTVILLAFLCGRLFLALALLGSFTTRAHAESSVLRRPSLHWVRADDALSCVDPRALAEHVEALVGPVLVRAPEAEHSIEGYVEGVGAGKLRVRVRVLDAGGHKVGERSFEQASEDCADLTPAVVFVIAMVIDPDVAAHGLPPALVALIGGEERPAEQVLLDELDKGGPGEDVEEEPEESTAEVVPPLPQADDPDEERPPSPRMQVSGLLRASIREAPRVALALDLRFLVEVRDPISALFWVRGGGQVGKHDLDASRSMRQGIVDAGAALCGGQSARASLRWTGCLGGEFTNALVSGDGFAGLDKIGIANAFGLVAQLTLRKHIAGPWGVAAMVGARFTLPEAERRVVFTDGDEDKQQVARLPAFSVGIALGPTFEF